MPRNWNRISRIWCPYMSTQSGGISVEISTDKHAVADCWQHLPAIFHKHINYGHYSIASQNVTWYFSSLASRPCLHSTWQTASPTPRIAEGQVSEERLSRTMRSRRNSPGRPAVRAQDWWGTGLASVLPHTGAVCQRHGDLEAHTGCAALERRAGG